MKVVAAMDSFKGSLTSMEAGEAVRLGILKAMPDAEVCIRPIADGGEGTVEALVLGTGGTLETIEVTGPLGEKVNCTYGILDEDIYLLKKESISNKNLVGSEDVYISKEEKIKTENLVESELGNDGKFNSRNKKTAIIEMAGAAGITLVSPDKRNPLYTTTYGVGEVIKDAIYKGCRHFIVGIGGSATNDGGIGMLQALGYGMLDKDGKQVSFGALGLKQLESITEDNVIKELKECTFRIACDVTNPLCGKSGCSEVFSPQKGADSTMIAQMDQWLFHYGKLTSEKYKNADVDYPGTGAAGGLGFAFLSYTNAVLESGIKIVLEETNLEHYIKDADIIITGEGRLDGQTIYGKAPVGVAKIAKKYGKPVIAFSGSVEEEASLCNEYGIDAFFPILRKVENLEKAMEAENAKKNMSEAVEQVFRLMKVR